MFSVQPAGATIGFIGGALAFVQVLSAQLASKEPSLDASKSGAFLKERLPEPPPRVTDSDCFDNGFEGIVQVTSGLFPADPDIAVGYDDVVIVTNQAIRVFDKSGSQVFNQTVRAAGGSGFWEADLGNGVQSFDALVHYDSEEDRFWIVGVQLGTPNILVAVSKETNPADTWYVFDLDTSAVSGIDSDLVAMDRPNSSVDDTAIWVNFWGGWSTGETYREGLVAINKAAVLALTTGDPITSAIGVMMPKVHQPSGSPPPPMLWRRLPAVHGKKPDTSDSAPLYLLQIDPDHVPRPIDQDPDVEFDEVVFHAVTLHSTNPWTVSPSITTHTLGVNSYYSPANCSGSANYEPCAEQLDGDGEVLDLNDTRFLDAVYRDGYFWAVHHARQSLSSSVDAVHWYKFDMNGFPTNNPTVEDEGWIEAEDADTYYPSIGVNSKGDAVISFNQSGDAEYISIRRDIVGVDSPCVSKESNTFYDNSQDGIQRWGDYSGTVSDPDNDCIFWSHHLWVYTSGNPALGSDIWRTWVSEHNICANEPRMAGRPDLNKDGVRDIHDILEFKALFDARYRRADWLRDGTHDVFDFIAYMNDFQAAQ